MQQVVVTGSRHWTAVAELHAVLAQYKGSHFHQGGARGVDRIAEMWCNDNFERCTSWPADWDRHGKSAGFKRNLQMLTEATPDLVLAFRAEGKSNGTDHTIREARRLGIPVRVVRS
jgi:hypothetical protein